MLPLRFVFRDKQRGVDQWTLPLWFGLLCSGKRSVVWIWRQCGLGLGFCGSELEGCCGSTDRAVAIRALVLRIRSMVQELEAGRIGSGLLQSGSGAWCGSVRTGRIGFGLPGPSNANMSYRFDAPDQPTHG